MNLSGHANKNTVNLMIPEFRMGSVHLITKVSFPLALKGKYKTSLFTNLSMCLDV